MSTFLMILFLYQLSRHCSCINYLDCTSFITESDCNAYKSEGCHWVKHVGECTPIHCDDFSSERESCVVYQSDYNCNWKELHQINHAICYEYCPKLFDIVFILNINNANDAPKVLSYTKSIISIFNSTYGSDSAHFGLILFSIIKPLIVFDLNKGWNAAQYLSQLDTAFDPNGRNSLLFNSNRANESKAISTAKHKVFQTSDRWQMPNTQLRKLAIYVSAQDYYSIEDICSYTKAFAFDIDDISFYGAKINTNGTFNCFGDKFKYITASIVSYDDLYGDIGYLLSSLCPHTLTPTVSPTADPTLNPTLSPTVAWHKICITNNTCVSSSNAPQFRFHPPFNGIISGISLKYNNGSRDDNSGYWGTSTLNQFAVFIEDYATQSPLYPSFSATRGVLRCGDKYKNSDELLDFYYCFDDDEISVNDTEFVLYSPSYSVTTNDEWSVVFVDDLLNAFMQHSEADIIQNGPICFAVYVLYDSINTELPTNAPHRNAPSSNPTEQSTLNPTKTITFSPTTFNPTADPSKVPSKEPSDTSIITTIITQTHNSTLNPSNPTSNPTFNPTFDPISDPTLDPTSNPTSDPTLDPTHDPSTFPTKTPTDHPTEAPLKATPKPTIMRHHAGDCCEWFAPQLFEDIRCDLDTLTTMRDYSDYLITNKEECRRSSHCGYSAYERNNGSVDDNCVNYWLNVIFFKQKCVKMKAYKEYLANENNTCYMCEEHQVVYNDSVYIDGICFPPSQIQSQSTVIPITTQLSTDDPTQDPLLIDTTSIPTLAPIEILESTSESASAEQHSQIIIHYSNTKYDIKDNKANGCEVIVKCGADRTQNLCLFVILSSALASAIIMYTIRSYYQWNFVKKDNDSYNDGLDALHAIGYIRQLSDKSDIEDIKKTRKMQLNRKKKENKKKHDDGDDDAEKEKKKKAKKKKKKAMRKQREDIKSRILAAISESDDIELGINSK